MVSRPRVVAVIASMLGALVVGTPAEAVSSDTATLMIWGSSYPGIGMTPAAQSLNLSGVATLTDLPSVISHQESCGIQGHGPGDSKAEGAGSFMLSCQSFTYFTCAYVRVAVSIAVQCLELGPPATATATGSFVLTPTDSDPVNQSWTTMVWTGELVLVRVT